MCVCFWNFWPFLNGKLLDGFLLLRAFGLVLMFHQIAGEKEAVAKFDFSLSSLIVCVRLNVHSVQYQALFLIQKLF